MSTQPRHPGASSKPGGLAGYLEAMDAGGTPLLGHLVLYSVFEGEVTPGQLQLWFTQLGLDAAFLPGPIRAVDAFEKVTGPSGVRHSYPLDNRAGTARRRSRQDGKGREATLMIRHVRRDRDQIVRHLVREVRDEESVQLSYDTRLAELTFRRDQAPSAEHGAGSLLVTPDHAAIRQLPASEHDEVGMVLTEIKAAYQRNCAYLTADRLRTVIRGYIEALNAIRVRPTGGVYFVHQAHAATLAALRELVSRLGEGSYLSRVPIPDQDEMREMVIAAFTTRSRDELSRLAADIATAQRDGATEATISTLHKRYRDLQASATEHAQLLNTSLDDTTAVMQLVNAQLATLLANAS
jgi:hypothetical protein